MKALIALAVGLLATTVVHAAPVQDVNPVSLAIPGNKTVGGGATPTSVLEAKATCPIALWFCWLWLWDLGETGWAINPASNEFYSKGSPSSDSDKERADVCAANPLKCKLAATFNMLVSMIRGDDAIKNDLLKYYNTTAVDTTEGAKKVPCFWCMVMGPGVWLNGILNMNKEVGSKHAPLAPSLRHHGENPGKNTTATDDVDASAVKAAAGPENTSPIIPCPFCLINGPSYWLTHLLTGKNKIKTEVAGPSQTQTPVPPTIRHHGEKPEPTPTSSTDSAGVSSTTVVVTPYSVPTGTIVERDEDRICPLVLDSADKDCPFYTMNGVKKFPSVTFDVVPIPTGSIVERDEDGICPLVHGSVDKDCPFYTMKERVNLPSVVSDLVPTPTIIPITESDGTGTDLLCNLGILDIDSNCPWHTINNGLNFPIHEGPLED